MLNLLQSELYKLRKEPSFRVLSLTLLLVAIALPLAAYYSASNGQNSAVNGIQSFMNGVKGNTLFMKIALAILAGFFISREYGSGVMKITGSSGYSRERIYAAKLTAFTIGIVFLSLLCPLVCMAVGSLLNGFGHLQETETAVYFFRTLGLTILFAIAFAAIVTAFAFMTKEHGVTIGIAMLVFLFFDTCSQLIGRYIPIYKYLYEHSVFKLFLEVSAFRLTSGELALSIAMPAVTACAFGWIGMMAFRKMDIQ
ncbi:ABC transporter permease [Cohnella nanjingensis]|uniref:ABC transporter permease n=1 Tax=Cohnella nanjingensis TaxID=1387779 RepID=A0A7X0RUT2_9BACL|nr:ABC transporter permease [Cohnella nanjingensis]MBB6672484.1 ABC transporter permease [Cohnella nanjingensis]